VVFQVPAVVVLRQRGPLECLPLAPLLGCRHLGQALSSGSCSGRGSSGGNGSGGNGTRPRSRGGNLGGGVSRRIGRDDFHLLRATAAVVCILYTTRVGRVSLEALLSIPLQSGDA